MGATQLALSKNLLICIFCLQEDLFILTFNYEGYLDREIEKLASLVFNPASFPFLSLVLVIETIVYGPSNPCLHEPCFLIIYLTFYKENLLNTIQIYISPQFLSHTHRNAHVHVHRNIDARTRAQTQKSKVSFPYCFSFKPHKAIAI